MSNTISVTSTDQISSNSVVRPPVRACPLDFIATRCKPIGEPRKGTVQVSVISSAASLATNPTDFQTGGDMTLLAAEITVAHVVRKGHASQPERNQGLNTSQLEQSLINDFEADLWAATMTAISTAAYGAADSTVAAASFAKANLKALVSACVGNPRTLLLPKAALNSIADDLKLGADGRWYYPGVDKGVFEAVMSGDVDVAILAGPQALTYHSENPGLLHLPPAEVKSTEILLPVLKIPAWKCEWLDKATRTRWISIESLFGIAPADASALSYAKSS